MDSITHLFWGFVFGLVFSIWLGTAVIPFALFMGIYMDLDIGIALLINAISKNKKQEWWMIHRKNSHSVLFILIMSILASFFYLFIFIVINN